MSGVCVSIFARIHAGMIAAVYDELFHLSTNPEDTVEFLAGLAGGGPVLELAIGTGESSFRWQLGGIEVEAIDASVAVVAKLRAKPGGEDIPVTIRAWMNLPAKAASTAGSFPTSTARRYEGADLAGRNHLRPDRLPGREGILVHRVHPEHRSTPMAR